MDEDKNKIDDFPYDAVLSGADKITSDHIVEQFKSMILSDKFPGGLSDFQTKILCAKNLAQEEAPLGRLLRFLKHTVL